MRDVNLETVSQAFPLSNNFSFNATSLPGADGYEYNLFFFFFMKREQIFEVTYCLVVSALKIP